jgi:rod shape determining protein RodA
MSANANTSGLRLERVLSLRRINWLRIDWHVLAIALALLGLGLSFVHAMDLADQEYGHVVNPIDFGNHLQKVLVTLPALALGLVVRPRWLRRNAHVVYGACLLLLVLVPLIGTTHNNSKRWIATPVGFELQPSELAKFGLIIALARELYTCRLRRWSEWVRPALFALLPMGLVALQPDLGTAMTIVPVTLGLFYVAGASARRLTSIVLAVVLCGALAFKLELIHDYQLERVDTWRSTFQPEKLIAARTGAAYHTYHARVAIGDGGWLGRGLGQGVANEAGALPERESDSIFAVIAEESGFFGTVGVLALYCLLIVLLLMSASAIRERFSRLVVCGIGLYFAAHYFVNIGVNLGLMPMTGLTLPLFSTGGSSMLVTFLALGLALGLSAQREPTLDEDAFKD